MGDTPVTTITCNNNIKNVMQEIKEVRNEVMEVKDSVSDLHILIAGLPSKILEKTDSRYANIGVEKLVWFIGGLVITAIVGALLAQVVK